MIAIQYVTSPLATPVQAKRYMVELASLALELDRNGVPVPRDFKTIDLVVLDERDIEPTLEEAGYLEGWEVVSSWLPSDGCEF
jgi:hypothetical protein